VCEFEVMGKKVTVSDACADGSTRFYYYLETELRARFISKTYFLELGNLQMVNGICPLNNTTTTTTIPRGI